MSNITFEMKRGIAVLSENAKGYTKEANLISWNGAGTKLDIREWYPNHARCGKGVTLTMDEGKALRDALIGFYSGFNDD